MSADFVLRLGWAAGKVLAPDGDGLVVIGKDTRSSGYMFESALEAGFSAAGMNIRLLGPMPTPGIAYLTRTFRADAGIVISASHNPYHDNGIKFFSGDGSKLADEIESCIEAAMAEPFDTVDSAKLGSARRVEDAAGRYIEFCKASVPYGLNLDHMNLVVDCAHGATYKIAPHVFTDLGANVTAIGVQPDGQNINHDCGSVHIEAVREQVLKTGADLGIAFDGDGDRVLMVDEYGELVDGDELLLIIAAGRQRIGRLQGPVVGTVMSNLGVEKALQAQGIEFLRAPVGDRYVLALLAEKGGSVGGETSGHIICRDRTTTGDGIIAALQVLCAMHETDRTLAEIKSGMHKYPQRLLNVAVEEKIDPHRSPIVRQAVTDAEQRLGREGRVVLRPSGTEPVIRVMVEGPEDGLVDDLAATIAAAVEQAAQCTSAA
jgi:phosphoglucosamine mutase